MTLDDNKMYRIKFKYADDYSNWEWRYQECVMSSVEACITAYGLGENCTFKILSVEPVD